MKNDAGWYKMNSLPRCLGIKNRSKLEQKQKFDNIRDKLMDDIKLEIE